MTDSAPPDAPNMLTHDFAAVNFFRTFDSDDSLEIHCSHNHNDGSGNGPALLRTFSRTG